MNETNQKRRIEMRQPRQRDFDAVDSAMANIVVGLMAALTVVLLLAYVVHKYA